MSKRVQQLRRRLRRLRHRARRLGEHHHLVRWRKVKRQIVKQRHYIERIQERNQEGVDVSYGRPHPDALTAADKKFICMYLNDIPGFGMSQIDAQRYSDAGLDLVAIFERGPEDGRLGYNKGVEHAKEAIEHAKRIGIPKGRPIYFAFDFEAKGPEVMGYAIGVRETLHKSNWVPGAYGDIDLIVYLFEHGLTEFNFQTYAWSHKSWSDLAHLRQVLINLPGAELEIGGSKVDFCKSTAIDFGQWNLK